MFRNTRHALLNGFVVIGTLLALTACTGTKDTHETAAATTSPPKPTAPQISPKPLGQPFGVKKDGPDGYDGLVNAFPVSKANATDSRDGTPRVFYTFNVRVSSTKGAFPSSDWSVETVNPTAVIPQAPDISVKDNSNEPPLGAKTPGNTAGYISFNVPSSATPTFLDLRDPTSSNTLIAQWILDGTAVTPPTTGT
ncbi:hypothetical protein [Mycobacteroides abscessus]|uniref:hypothetical protein n=1 Tax=Mycobacteroides abscessus TaxID=36809 RepID=UPI0009A8A0C3|nr:hypothetical protein [Mycobacteroides abscessus]SKP38709.1 Uncharacterised protein [Mycobacteroides abscessus subsp. abscessus]